MQLLVAILVTLHVLSLLLALYVQLTVPGTQQGTSNESGVVGRVEELLQNLEILVERSLNEPLLKTKEKELTQVPLTRPLSLEQATKLPSTKDSESGDISRQPLVTSSVKPEDRVLT